MLGYAFIEAWPRLGIAFLTSPPSRTPEIAGVLPALVGSACLMILTAALSIPVGVGAALYLEEYARPGHVTSFIELQIANLAGVPSIIYGLLGLEIFVRALGLGRSLIAGAATLSLLLLPMIIMVLREALRTVPRSMREAAWALGADRFRAPATVVLPMCMQRLPESSSRARAIGDAPLVRSALTYGVLASSLGSRSPLQSRSSTGSEAAARVHVNAAAARRLLVMMLL